MEGIGDRFQHGTGYRRGRIPRDDRRPQAEPPLYKTYPQADRVDLPFVQDVGGPGLYTLIRKRRSVRDYADRPIRAETLAWLLWAATGITRTRPDWAFRSAPSAGALYPIETYLSIHRVEGVEPGIYHYAVGEHKLERLRAGSAAAEVAAAALDQPMCAQAAGVFIWTAVFARTLFEYGQRGYRYVYLDAGHIAQNLALAAVAAGLGSCPVAALYDDEANALLDIDGTEESVIYMTTVGYPAGRDT